MKRERWQSFFNYVLSPLLAVVLGLLVGAVIICMIGDNPLAVYRAMLQAVFGSVVGFANTLQWATPILLTGLSAVMAFRSGVFSIGMQGQYLFGALAAGTLGAYLSLPAVVHPAVILVAGALAGSAWSALPGWLKVKWQVNEIITTIVTNFIAVLIFGYLISGPLRDPAEIRTTFTPVIADTAKLTPLIPGSRLGAGFLMALIVAVLVQLYLWRTTWGYEQRMAMSGPNFARAIGINVSRAQLRGMLLSGAISGFAGAIEVLGVHYRLMGGFGASLAFDGVMVAILGLAMPVGVTFNSILFAGLRQGALALAWTTETPRQLGGTIIALIVLFMAIRTVILKAVERLQARRKTTVLDAGEQPLEHQHV